MNSVRFLSFKNQLYILNRLKQFKPARYIAIEPSTCILHLSTSTNVNLAAAGAPSSKKKGIISRIREKLGFEDLYTKKLRARSILLYEKAIDNLNIQLFFETFNMPDTFNSWFLVVELHVWMLIVRLMADVNNGKMLRDQLLEYMWQDFAERVKKIGPTEASLRRKGTIALSEQMNAAFAGYDEGIMNDDMVLAGALWRRFFNRKCDDPEHLERLVCYVRKQISVLDKTPLMDFLYAKQMNWENIKTCTKLS